MTTSAMLWKPSRERVARANITEFARNRAAAAGATPPDYAALWRWSNDEREAFWRAVWDYAGVIGERGERTLVDSDEDARREVVSRRAAQFRRESARASRVRRRRRCARLSRRGQARAPCVACRARRDRIAHRRCAEGDGHPRRRPRRGVHPEHARGDHRDARRREPGRRLVVVLARFRRAGRARPLRADRAARALHRGRLLVQRQGAADRRQGRRDRGEAALGRARRRHSVPRSERAGRAEPRRRAQRDVVGGFHRADSTPRRSTTSGCRSTIRSTSSIRRGRPACRSASSMAPAERCSST